MKNLKFALLALSAILVMGFTAQAQLSIHAGGVLPLGTSDEGIDNVQSIDQLHNLFENDNIYAGMGINIGAKMAVPVFSGLKIFGGIDLNYNPTKKETQDDIDKINELFGSIYNINTPKYLSFPISAGVEYAYAFGHNMEVFVDGGLVFNSLKITNAKSESEAIKSSTTIKSKLATALGFKVGAGLWFTKNIGVQVNYFGVGDHEINREITNETAITSNTVDSAIKPKTKLGLLTFGVAYRM